MPIYLNSNKDINSLYVGRSNKSFVYLGGKSIWVAVKSCFSSGGWNDDKPWIDEEGWKD